MSGDLHDQLSRFAFQYAITDEGSPTNMRAHKLIFLENILDKLVSFRGWLNECRIDSKRLTELLGVFIRLLIRDLRTSEIDDLLEFLRGRDQDMESCFLLCHRITELTIRIHQILRNQLVPI